MKSLCQNWVKFHLFLAFSGWFYHAPARAHRSDDPMLYPPMSQIPGLTEDDALPPDDSQPRPLFRDSDTKYVRLAKEGGRRSKFLWNPKGAILREQDIISAHRHPFPKNNNNKK